MDRPFYLLLGAATVISFGTVWMATGVATAPLPAPIVVEAPPTLPSGPANPDAASPLTVPVRVDAGSSTMGSTNTPSGPIDPTPALTLPGTTQQPMAMPQQQAYIPPPAPVYVPPPPPPPADTGGPAPQSPPAG